MRRLLAGLVIAFCLAAGAAGSASSAALPADSQLIENWNGAAWTITPSEGPQGGNYLNAATALSAANVWAVGSYVKIRSQTLIWHPLAEHYNGVSWSPLVLPTPRVKAQSDLFGVSASSATDVWAVGAIARASNAPVNDALIEHFKGSSWKVAQILENTTGSTTLSGVVAVARKNAWAVGSSAVSPLATGSKPLIEHWNGSAWRPVKPRTRAAPTISCLRSPRGRPETSGRSASVRSTAGRTRSSCIGTAAAGSSSRLRARPAGTARCAASSSLGEATRGRWAPPREPGAGGC